MSEVTVKEMGTTSLIYFQNGYADEDILAVVYQQHGGDLSGVGRVLAAFLKEETTPVASDNEGCADVGV